MQLKALVINVRKSKAIKFSILHLIIFARSTLQTFAVKLQSKCSEKTAIWFGVQ